MKLVDVALRGEAADAPPLLAEFLLRAETVEDSFREATDDDPIPGFVSSDGLAVWRALKEIDARGLAPGPYFLEWGSGLGLATAIASFVGFQAAGIEIEARLVQAAKALAKPFAPRARYAAGSFIPAALELDVEPPEEMDWLVLGAEPAYDELDLEPDEVDLFYAYPWPGEEDRIFHLFRDVAARGALLLTWHGIEGMRLQRLR